MKSWYLAAFLALASVSCARDPVTASSAGETLESYVIREALSDAPDPAKAKVLTLGFNEDRTRACGTMRVGDRLVVPVQYLEIRRDGRLRRTVATGLVSGRYADKIAVLLENMCAQSGIVERAVE